MSKAVKKVGRAIGKVVKGVGKAVKKVWDGTVGKVWAEVKRSDILKTVAIAAAVYFTGGAALGALGGMGGGLSGMLVGAQAGFGTALTGVTSAWSSLAAGELLTAGSQLVGGLTGAGAAGFNGALASGAISAGTTMPGWASGAAGLLNGAGTTMAGQAGFPTLPPALTQSGTVIPGATNYTALAQQSGAQLNALGVPTAGAAPTASGGLLGPQPLFNSSQMAQLAAQNKGIGTGLSNVIPPTTPPPSGSFFSDPLVKYGLLQTGGNMLSGYAQGRDAEDQAQKAYDTYNRNIGSPLGRFYLDPTTGRVVFNDQVMG